MISPGESDIRIMVDFSDPAAADDWSAIDDRIMGGVSRSMMRSTEGGTAEFAGTMSLESGGGFASVRSGPRSMDLSWARGVAIRVRGDGRTYRFRIRTETDFNGPSYQAAFPALPEWTTVRLPFDAFVVSFRGQRLPGAPPLDPSAIQTFGLLVADRQDGPFRLEVAWIGAWA